MTIKNNTQKILYENDQYETRSTYVDYNSEGIISLGFDYNETFITDPFASECSRFVLDPIKDYGLTKKQTNDMIKYNKLDEELI